MASKRQYILELLLGAKTDSSYDSNIQGAGQSLTGLSSTAKKAAGLITAAFAAVNITGAITDAVEEYAEFEQELTNTAATAGATQPEYEQMEKAAREAGMATTKTASESAAALGYMALAGWSVNESTEALMPVLKLSEATQLDLARTSDLVTDSMSALKLEVSDLPEYLDLVTKGQNSSNQTAEQMMEAYIRAGGAARSLGIDVKDTGIALGILANNGIKASEGGRSINAMLTRMSANDTAIGQLKALNVSIFDAKGNFVGFEEALKRINKGLSGLTMEEQAQALKDIAGTQYYTKLKYLLDSVKNGAKGTDSAWTALDKNLSDSEGTLDKMSSRMTNTMSGSVKIMQSAISDAKISFGDAFDEEIVEVIHDITGMFNNISEGITSFADENGMKIHNAFESVKENITGAGKIIGDFAVGAIENFDMVKSAVAGFAAMSFASKTIKQFKTIKDAFGSFALGSVSKGNLIAGGIALAAGAVAAIGVHVQNTQKKLVQADLGERFGDITLSLEGIDEVSQQIVGKKKLTQISEMLESIGKTDDAVEEMTASMKNISRISWKVKAGFKLDIEETNNYKAYIENYIKSAQDVLDNQGYSVSVATDILFGKKSKMSEKNNAFYAGLDAELGGLEKKLNKKISKAVENGVDINTDKSIQKLLGKVNAITAAITDAQEEAGWQQLDAKYSGKDLDAETFKALSDDVQKQVKNANKGIDEAYNTELTNINAQKNIKLSNLKEKFDSGKITSKQYDKSVIKAEKKHEVSIQDTTKAYKESKVKNMVRGSQYLVKTITDAYPEAKEAIERFNKLAEENIMSGEAIIPGLAVSNAGLPNTQKKAIKSLYKSGLDDIIVEMRQYADELKNTDTKIPEAFAQTFNSAEALGAISGSGDDAISYFNRAINENEQWSVINDGCSQKGTDVVTGIATALDNSGGMITAAGAQVLSRLGQALSGNVTAQIGLNLNLSGQTTGIASLPASTAPPKGTLIKNRTAAPVKTSAGGKIAKNARGGIYSHPVLSILAEERNPEAVIPLNNSSRAKALWQNAGKMLGMTPVEDNTLYNTMSTSTTQDNKIYKAFETEYNNDNSITDNKNFYENLNSMDNPASSNARDKKIYADLMAVRAKENSPGSPGDNKVSVVYSPQITIQGNADKKTIEKALSINKAKIAKMLDEYFYSKKRTAMRR